VAVDPTSPFTGGAVLGDRVRMRDLVGDSNIFIRSMASRGALGGLARATAAVTQVFDAAGYDVVLIETVGAGQSEVDIARLAHTTLVVEAPGLGDDVQAIKAGILEIADILVVNKADRPGAENTRRALEMMVEMAHPTGKLGQHPNCPPENADLLHRAGHLGGNGEAPVVSGEAPVLPGDAPVEDDVWIPPVILTTAQLTTSVEPLFLAVLRHEAYLRASGEWQQREQARLRAELDALLQAALVARWQDGVSPQERQTVFADLAARKIAPLNAVRRLLGEESRDEA
jgi:LAO/AO transport system kinase